MSHFALKNLATGNRYQNKQIETLEPLIAAKRLLTSQRIWKSNMMKIVIKKTRRIGILRVNTNKQSAYSMKLRDNQHRTG
jgi:hypothetical protein